MKFAFIIFLFIVGANACKQKTNSSKEEWIQLFNGKDVSDWHIQITGHAPNENFKNTFKVDSGILKISYDKYDHFGTNYGHLYYKKPFSYYKLRAEYRFVGTQTPGGANWAMRNSGLMVHCQPPETLAPEQEFPVSIEVQLLGGLGDGKPRTTANLCTPGTMVEMNGKLNTDHCINSSSETYHGDQWVTVEVLVLGDSLIQHIINDKVVLQYNKPRVGEITSANFLHQWGTKNEGLMLKEGYIALQAESHPVHFRKVELLNLKGCMNPKCDNYKPYYIAHDDCNCKD